jgi:hypothetical protein
MCKLILATFAIVLLLSPLKAMDSIKGSPLPSVELSKVAAPPKIDGLINNDEWSNATKIELRFQIEPGDNLTASERTEAFFSYDREYLYFAFLAYDNNPSAIRAPVSKRDDVLNDDYVTVMLDTYADRQRAYVFNINPLGIQSDGIFTESASTDYTWDGIFESKGSLTKDGYVIEAAIPFKTLRFRTGKDAAWGMHIRRWIARKAERTSWTQISHDNSGLPI